VFSCGWHITRDGQDVSSRTFKGLVRIVAWLGRLTRMVEVDDQVEACRRIFASDARWTVVPGSGLEEGESQGLPVWSRHVGDPILTLTRRVDFALFMVAALENDALVHEAPAIVGCVPTSSRAKRHERSMTLATEDHAEGRPGGDAERGHGQQEVARFRRPLGPNKAGCGGVQPAVLAAVEWRGVSAKAKDSRRRWHTNFIAVLTAVS
jgi:hypothetical protein